MRQFEVIGIVAETPDTTTYVLVPKDGAPVSWLAGQFLTLVISLNGRELRRSYSISSFPGSSQRLQITVKKVVNGEVSRYLLSTLRPGSTLSALEPAGRFVLPEQPARAPAFVFVAAGSGITPVFSLVGQLLARDSGTVITLITQFRREGDIIFRRQLERFRLAFPGTFEWISRLSRPGDSGARARRLNNGSLEVILKERSGRFLPGTQFYICGPPSFQRMVTFTLRETGVPETVIRHEFFELPRPPGGYFRMDPAPHRITMEAGRMSRVFYQAWPDSLLEAAEKNGLSIPYSCRGGICATCVMRCVSGTVRMRINEVLTPADLAAGLVLTCVGFAVSDVVFRRESDE